MTQFQDGIAVYMPPKREPGTDYMTRALIRERRLRREAEELQQVYSEMALAGGLVMILLAVFLCWV